MWVNSNFLHMVNKHAIGCGKNYIFAFEFIVFMSGINWFHVETEGYLS